VINLFILDHKPIADDISVCGKNWHRM